MPPRVLRLLLATGAGLALGLAAAAADPQGESVLYPRAPRSAAAPADERSGRANSVLVGVALLAAAAGGWLLWRQRRSPAGAGAAARHLSIAESKPLGNRQYLVVADYAGRKFLLGVCPGRIELLTPLGDGQPFEEER